MITRTLATLTIVMLASGCIDTSGLVFGGQGGGAQGYASVVLADEPLAYWRLDDHPDTFVLADATGHGHEAVRSSSGTVTIGVPGAVSDGTAASLADDGSLFVDAGHPFSFPGAPYTLEAWVRLDGSAPKTNLWSCHPDGGKGYSTFYGDDQLSHKRYADGLTETETASAPATFFDFRHLAFVFDGADGRWYLDGVVASPPTDSTVSWSGDVPAPFELGVGTSHTLTLDEVAVYDHALDAQRIAAHHDCGAGGLCD